MANITFDQAIELLEIVDLSKISVEDLSKIERTAKKRWHPDKVAHLKSEDITQEYTAKFKSIEYAIEIIKSYLQGDYKAGEAFSKQATHSYEEPEEIIRKNASEMQAKLKEIWFKIRELKYKLSIKEVVLSDGFKLKDLLSDDFKEDIAMKSIVSLLFGGIIISLVAGILSIFIPGFNFIGILVLVVHVIFCILGVLPLSRFWLTPSIGDLMIYFINFGFKPYVSLTNSKNTIVVLLLLIPTIFVLAFKYVILFPIYEIAKILVKDKVVGVVTKEVSYYADVAEWYIDELIVKNPIDMTKDELHHLSYIYSQFKDAEKSV